MGVMKDRFTEICLYGQKHCDMDWDLVVELTFDFMSDCKLKFLENWTQDHKEVYVDYLMSESRETMLVRGVV